MKCQWNGYSRQQRRWILCERPLCRKHLLQRQLSMIKFSVVIANKSQLRMKLDTSASAKVMSWKTFNRLLASPHLQPSNVCWRAYGNHIIDHKGKATLTCKVNHHEDVLEWNCCYDKSSSHRRSASLRKTGMIRGTDCPPSQPSHDISPNIWRGGHITTKWNLARGTW